ncbi:hypothetical protein I4U23_021630 [Adineta vaga]|nr:hypothetical protein I4U23_021630 [Adineta vaga]
MIGNARCTYGCACSDDSSCEYYCDNGMCQNQVPLWQKCSSYYIHPRQCGSVSYCDPDSSFTCQLKKNYGERCTYSYTCLSDNCDYSSNTCQSKYTPVNLLYPVIIPCAFIFFVVIITIIIVATRRQRMRAFAYNRSPYVVLPAGTPYSYQNSYFVGDVPPPAYPGAIATPKPYQSS